MPNGVMILNSDLLSYAFRVKMSHNLSYVTCMKGEIIDLKLISISFFYFSLFLEAVKILN